MSQATLPSDKPKRAGGLRRWLLAVLVLIVTAGAGYALVSWLTGGKVPLPGLSTSGLDFDGAVGWLNTTAPIKADDLRGKVVLLNFWTEGCINCMHMVPTLARLEKTYPNELVIIGVHSPKFENEKDPKSIEKAIQRYQITHPVINDANRVLWKHYQAEGWPTLVFIDPDGHVSQPFSGEASFGLLERRVGEIIRAHRDRKTLNEKPLAFATGHPREADGPLYFPGKVLADGQGRRLFIADSTHHRIVITDLDGKKIAVAGDGQPGRVDGPFAKARFYEPQGMALRGETLYVADRKNHSIRALDLKAQKVQTVAGTGEQESGQRPGGPALKTGLNSPWDVAVRGDQVFIAMAGDHQIWALDLEENEVTPFAGSGMENRLDGRRTMACFAQPSGLSLNGGTLYVADSEDSSIRTVQIDGTIDVKTIVGKDVFSFGDEDGQGDAVRLQHPLGVAFHDGKVYVADTYNSKIKVIDPAARSCTTLVAPTGGERLFNEPGGLSCAGDKLYVADTNAHRIRVVDLATKSVRTLDLQGVEAPRPER